MNGFVDGQNNIPLDSFEIKKRAEEFLTQKTKETKLDHKDIFNVILRKIELVNFNELAALNGEEKLSQKHQIVLCIEQILKTIRKENFDLARKNDFIYVYNGEYWKENNRETLKNFLSKAAEELGVSSLEARHYEFTDKLYKQFLKEAYFEPVEQDINKTLVNFANGTFEIDGNTQKLREFRKSDFLTYQLPFDYDETASCPKFRDYCNRVLPEKELQDVVAEFLGYPFIKHLKLEKAALFYGSGANGKSVLFDVMRELYGRENIASFSLANLMEEHNRALIANKLLNYGSEINATTTKDIFKNLVSTEPIQARLKYGNSFQMEDYAKLCFNCNELPRDIERNHAYFRRLIIIPFRITIPESEQDKELAQKIIKDELPGVFNWILEGLQRLLENKKFTESKIVQFEVERYKQESDSIAMFIEEFNLVKHSTKTLLLKDVYLRYKDFCGSDGYRAYNKKNFSQRLRNDFGFVIEKQRSGMNIFSEYLVTG